MGMLKLLSNILCESTFCLTSGAMARYLEKIQVITIRFQIYVSKFAKVKIGETFVFVEGCRGKVKNLHIYWYETIGDRIPMAVILVCTRSFIFSVS